MSGKTSAKSINKYMTKAYDRINVIVPKGDKDKYKAFAQSQGKSLNGLIIELLNKEMQKEGQAE